MSMNMSFTSDLGLLPTVAGAGLLTGGLWSVGKYLMRQGRKSLEEDSDHDLPVGSSLKPSKAARIPVDVPVSAEEADELRRLGIEVRRKKLAAAVAAKPNWTNAAIYGGVGLASLLTGVYGADYLMDLYRKSDLDRQRKEMRQRLRDIVEDRPSIEDALLHKQMKTAEAAEERRLKKQAFGIGDVAAAGVTGLAGIAALRMISGALSGAAKNKGRASSKAIMQQYRTLDEERPTAYLRPVEVEDRPEDTQSAAVRVEDSEAILERERKRREELRQRALKKMLERRTELPTAPTPVAVMVPATAPVVAPTPAPVLAPAIPAPKASAAVF